MADTPLTKILATRLVVVHYGYVPDRYFADAET